MAIFISYPISPETPISARGPIWKLPYHNLFIIHFSFWQVCLLVLVVGYMFCHLRHTSKLTGVFLSYVTWAYLQGLKWCRYHHSIYILRAIRAYKLLSGTVYCGHLFHFGIKVSLLNRSVCRAWHKLTDCLSTALRRDMYSAGLLHSTILLQSRLSCVDVWMSFEDNWRKLSH